MAGMNPWKLLAIIPIAIIAAWFYAFSPRNRQRRGDDETITLFSESKDDEKLG
jgi:cbb3-type cytochrome oxidase subunit 3